jgi:hypothetical protein
MSGAVAAHAAYNGSGTQGLAVTNKIQDQEGDVMSVFWNKNDTTRQLLHGSTILEVPASGNNGNVNFGGSKIFTINNDIDCLGELYLNMKVTIENNFTSRSTGTWSNGTSSTGGALTDGQVADFGASGSDVNVAGSGYALGDVLQIAGGNATNLAQIEVTKLAAGGGVDEFRVIKGGAGYTTTSGATTTAITGTGTLATIDVVATSGAKGLKFDADSPSFKFKLGALTKIIERIEYQVGTQIWQTLEKDDVRVVYNTEMSEAAYNSVSRRGRPTTASTSSVYDASTANWTRTGKDVDVTFIIPALTKTLAPQLETFTNISESGYPLAAAPHQSVKIKIYFANSGDTTLKISGGVQVVSPSSIPTPTFFEVVNSPYLSEIGYRPIYSGTTVSEDVPLGPPPISLKSIKLYSKHIIMCNEEREQMKAMPLGLPKRLKMTQNALITDVSTVLQKTIDLDHFSLYASHLIISGDLGKDVYIKSAELKLNSSSFSGVIPAQMLDYAAASSLGLYVNRNIESDQTEVLDGLGVLVFPLASSAYSGSSVPFNRFDSIRLTLAFTGTASVTNPYINITCVGETTALFKGGAASLAMY